MAEATINAGEAARAVCRYCGARTGGAHFCPGCGKIQPVEAGTDYFAFFGLPRKLALDEAALEKDFYSLSRKLHPDYFMNATGAERRASIERSSMLNDAYRTLRDPVSRARYLLSLEGFKEAEKKSPPPDLLEEVFELNMQVEELKMAKKTGDEAEVSEARDALEGALKGLEEKLSEIDGRLSALFADWDAALDLGAGDRERRAVLESMSELLSHRSYIRNLVRDVKEEL
jgi:molecular chaperone HscB